MEADPADGVVATLASRENEDLATVQKQDEELVAMIVYLETGVLPEDTVVA